MATNQPRDDEMYIKLCKLVELFSGRYTIEEAATILAHENNSLDGAVNLVLHSEPSVLRALLETEQNSWTTIEAKTRRLKKEHWDGQRHPSILDRARSGKIDTEARQFACKACDNFWWQRTPSRKVVSRCKLPVCRRKYDAIPRQMEWGVAEFNCTECKRQFRGFSAMYIPHPCYGCGRMTKPTRIIPQEEQAARPRDGRGPRRNNHQCAAPDCFNRQYYTGPMPTGDDLRSMTCVHPQSRRLNNKPKVVNPSDQHDSTGSTVNTFLSQTDLTKNPEIFYPSLDPVNENGEDDTGSLSGHAGSGSDAGHSDSGDDVASGVGSGQPPVQ